MSNRTLGSLFAALLLLTTNAAAQGSTAKKEPVADGRTLSARGVDESWRTLLYVPFVTKGCAYAWSDTFGVKV